MTQLELQQYLLREYSQENARCEWKEFKNLKDSFCGDEKDDVIFYVSAIANNGGHLVIGVKDKTLEFVGTDISRLILNTLFSCGSDRILAALGKDRIASFYYISDGKENDYFGLQPGIRLGGAEAWHSITLPDLLV